jgi:hypothetical protein
MKNSNIGVVTGDAIIALSTGKLQAAKGFVRWRNLSG